MICSGLKAFLTLCSFDEPITEKYGTTWVWERDKFEAAKESYYTDRLKLTKNGMLPEKELERLGLSFVVPALKPLGAIA